jgi:hypothetical protein
MRQIAREKIQSEGESDAERERAGSRGCGARFRASASTGMKGGLLLGFLADRRRVAFAALIGLFLWCVGQFHHRETGFSSMISIGDLLTPTKVTALKQVPHYVYESSPGYDGAYYVQLALYPTLDNPELTKAIDNLPYRAKRILFCWAAWMLGLGQPAWIVQAHALLNVGCWIALAFLLLRWFPLDRWDNLLRWAGVMFSHGVCMSVRHSLVDAPSLLLVALALRWLENGKSIAGATTLALAGLGKETSLLASAGTNFSWRAPKTWWRVALTVALIAVPLLAWMAFIKAKFGPAEDPGLGNFTWPFAGYAEKFGASWAAVVSSDRSAIDWAVLATVVALAVQWGFLAFRWRATDRWWRVGAAFALMMVFLSTPVWEGYPGASTRVLLPMTLAFNVLVPRGVRWLPVLLAGNLTVAASVFEFSPPHEFYTVRGTAASELRVTTTGGWHGPERHLSNHWRWARAEAKLTLLNTSTQPLAVTLQARVASVAGARAVRVLEGAKLLWGERVTEEHSLLRFGLVVPPGETLLTFTSDQPAQKVSTDPRDLAFQVANLDIVVRPAADQR